MKPAKLVYINDILSLSLFLFLPLLGILLCEQIKMQRSPQTERLENLDQRRMIRLNDKPVNSLVENCHRVQCIECTLFE